MARAHFARSIRPRFLTVVAAFALAAASIPTATALTVTNLLDSGGGSLRSAVAGTAANGTVDFQPGLSGTITLASTITIDKSLTIDGGGAAIAVSGNNAVRIFDVTVDTTTLTVRNLALANGFANLGTLRGGAIATNGAVVADTVSFTGNRAGDGGGAVFIGPSTGAPGPSIILNSMFSGNSVTGTGGAGGGAILVAGDTIGPKVPSLTLQNTTVSGNSANASFGMAGGGVAIATASLTVISSTIAANHAGAAGSDLHQGTLANTTVTLTNSVVGAGIVDVAPFDATDRDLYQPGGAGLTSGGFNVIQQKSGAIFAGTDLLNTDPKLGALQNNGGPTFTQALLAGSPAIDLVSPLSACADYLGNPLTRDQRNGVRGFGGNLCDAGAYEVQMPVALAYVQQPTSATAGASIAPPITVSLVDTFGVVTPSTANVTLAIGANPGGGTLSGTTTVAAVAGTATFSNLSIDKVGVGYTLVASSAGLTGATSTAFNIAAGAPSKLVIGQQPTSTTAGASIAPAVTVQIVDVGGNPTTSNANVTVAIGANPGGGTLSGTLTVAAVNGTATFAGLSIDKAGVGYTLAASAAGLTGATSGAFNITAGAANKLVVGQQPTNTPAGASIAPAVTIAITDAFGNATTSTANVTLAIGTNPGGGTLSGTLTVAAVAGTATFANLSIDKAGVGYTLAASSAGLTGATSTAFNITAGAANKLAFAQQPTNTTGGASIAPAVTVQITDTFGNLTASNANVTIAIGANPGGGTLSGTLTVAAVAGTATFANLSIDKAGVGYTLAASSTGLTGATSTAFNITAGAANKLAFVQQPTNTTGGAAIAPAVTVQITDAFGNLTASNANVTIAIGTNPGGGTLSGTFTVAAVAGTATFANLSIDKAGVGYTLAASSAGLTGATSAAFNITAGAANKLVFAQQPTNAASAAAIAPPITVQITDTFGNLTASNANVTIAIGTNPGGGTLSGTTTVAAVAGIATFANLSIDKAGVGYTLAASSAGLAGATSSAFNITAGAANKVVFAQQPSNVVAGASIAPAVTAQIQDAFGNLVNSTANVALAIGTNAGGGTLSGTLTVAAVAGTATFNNLSIDKSGVGYTLAASSAGLAGATSNTFDVSAGPPTHLAFLQQPTSSAAGATIAPAVTVQLLDAFNNVSNIALTVTLAIGTNPSGGVLSGTTSVAAVAGTATFTPLSIDKPGPGYTLVASSGALPAVTSAAFDITNRLLTVPLPGGGVVTIALAGGGAACSFVSGGYVPLTGGPASPPSGSAPGGYAFPYGLANFTATPCAGTITLTYTFPAPLPPSSVIWKYGKTTALPAAHWYAMPATLAGNTATVTIADGGLGDDDLAVNGTIVDPSGVGLLAIGGAAIPTLQGPALLLLALLLALSALYLRRRSR